MWPGGAKGLFPSSKFRPSIKHQPNVVYKIPCAAGEWCYIGETGRSNIAKHAWSFDLRIDFDNSSVFDKGSFRGIIKTLETWRTSATKHADNYSKPILTSLTVTRWCFAFVVFIVFISPLLAYILSFCISFLSVQGCRLIAKSSF